MKRILHVFAKLTRGGIETFVMNVYRCIDRTQFQFDFLLTQKGGEYEDEVRSMGGQIYYIEPRNKGFVNYSKNLEAFFKENVDKFYAIHQHAPTLTSLEPLFYAKKYGIKKRIIHAHSSSVSGAKYHYILHFFGKFLVKSLATNYIACSEKARNWLFNYTGISMQDVLMLNNGIDVSKFSFNSEIRIQKRKELGVENQVVIGHVGRFIKVKNHPFLISIFYEYHKLVPNSMLLLVGNGENLNAIKEQVESLNLTEYVKFLGSRSDVHLLLQALDVFIMPSLFEGFPVSLIEVQTSGLLTVISDTIAHESKLIDDLHFLSLKKSPKEWANDIFKYQNIHKRIDCSKQIIDKGFDINMTTKILENLYN